MYLAVQYWYGIRVRIDSFWCINSILTWLFRRVFGVYSEIESRIRNEMNTIKSNWCIKMNRCRSLVRYRTVSYRGRWVTGCMSLTVHCRHSDRNKIAPSITLKIIHQKPRLIRVLNPSPIIDIARFKRAWLGEDIQRHHCWLTITVYEDDGGNPPTPIARRSPETSLNKI